MTSRERAKLTCEQVNECFKELLGDTYYSEWPKAADKLFEHTRALAAPALGWTKERPTVEGMYWYRQSDQVQEIVRVKIDINNHPRTRPFASGEETYDYVDMLDGEWAGPIEPPLEVPT